MNALEWITKTWVSSADSTLGYNDRGKVVDRQCLPRLNALCSRKSEIGVTLTS